MVKRFGATLNTRRGRGGSSRWGSMEWRTAVERWTDYMRAAGDSSGTVEQRRYHVGRLARDLGGVPAAVTFDDLAAWLGRGEWAPNTRRAYRASLRAFFRWAVSTGLTTSSPAAELPPVRIPRGRPRPAPEDAFRLALKAADDRARLAIRLAGVCGLRRGEIAKARREDLERDLTGWSLRVVGKGGHVRLVPLPETLARDIRSRPAGWLFPSSHGGHLTPHHLGKIVTRCLPDGLTTHTLRHRCGTVAYAATKDLRAVQELLGHAKPETTALYTEVPTTAIRAAVEGAA